ncbi:hypothetical protein AAG906_003252 [Vitis piasezkii]
MIHYHPPPPPAVRPFEGAAFHEGVRREDDEVLRQLQSTQARIYIWSLLASSSTHRDALIRALSQIRVETTTTPKRLIHMMTADRATCIVFSDDNLPPRSDHSPISSTRQWLTLNVCPLATAITLGFAPSDFGPSTQTVRAYDSTKREVMGFLHPLTCYLADLGYIESELSLLPFIRSEDDLFLTGFTFDEIQTLEIEDFHRDFVAMSFDQHSSTVVLDMMRGMTFLPGMGMSLDDYFVRGSEIRPRVEEVHSVVHTDREIELQHLFHQLQLSDGAHGASVSVATPTSPDRASMLSLCFPEDITDDGVIVDPTEMVDGVVPHDEYRDEMDRMTLLEDDNSLFEGIVSLVERASDLVDPPLSFDVLSGFVSRSDDVSVALFMDLIKIGSPYLMREMDLFIYSGSYLDVFAWSYEDMPGLDPSIQKLRRLHPRWSLQVKEEIQKQLSVGFISVVEYPEWLANVVPIPKKDGKVRVCLIALQPLDVVFHGWIFEALERIRKFRLRLNPKKCTFGVTSGKLLGHMNNDCRLAFEKIKGIYFLLCFSASYARRPLLLYFPLVWATRRLRHYMTEYSFDIQYVSRKSIKGSIVADHLASLPISDSRPVDDDFPDEEFIAMTSLSSWRMYFDGAANHSGFGIVEYEACILGLETALELDIRQMKVFSDSNLFLRSGTYPEVATAKDRRALRNLATRFVICGDTLYRRSADGMLLLCLDRASADRVMRECRLMAISFMHHHRVTRFDLAVTIFDGLISDRGVHFRAEVDTLLQKYGIRHHRSSAYRPQTNGKLPFALWAYCTFSHLWSYTLLFSIWYGGRFAVETEMGSPRVALEQQIYEAVGSGLGLTT